jgi:hypothetical protein
VAFLDWALAFEFALGGNREFEIRSAQAFPVQGSGLNRYLSDNPSFFQPF